MRRDADDSDRPLTKTVSRAERARGSARGRASIVRPASPRHWLGKTHAGVTRNVGHRTPPHSMVHECTGAVTRSTLMPGLDSRPRIFHTAPADLVPLTGRASAAPGS